MDQSKEILSYLKRVDSKLTALLNKPKTETWVKVSVVQELTGWDHEWMRKARMNGLIKYRKADDRRVFEYVIESIPETFLKKQTA